MTRRRLAGRASGASAGRAGFVSILLLSSVFPVFLIVGLGQVLSGAGQQPPAPAGREQPTFKVQVDYVEVDALVTDGAGNFVRDLKKEDFQVMEDGKVQAITAFTLVDLPVERVETRPGTALPIDPDVRTNE